MSKSDSAERHQAVVILEFTDDCFDERIRQTSVPVLVDFWASWCRPCKVLAPVLAELAQELGSRVRVARVNVEDNGDLANRFGIRSVPTLVLFKNGRVVDQMIGAAPIDEIRALVLKNL